jgi:uncharacterized protein YsxB (DUF464 family)
MIIIRYNQNEITASGHSGYAESGNDIVCASISTAFRTTAEIMNAMGYKFFLGISEEVPYIGIQLSDEFYEQTYPYFKTLVKIVKDLAEEFPKNLKVFEVETKVKKDKVN